MASTGLTKGKNRCAEWLPIFEEIDRRSGEHTKEIERAQEQYDQRK
jgi:hypothetical protein